MLKLIELLDDKGTFAAALVGVLALISMPVTYGGENFQASTVAAVIAIASLLISALLRFSVWALENIREKLYLTVALVGVVTLESFLIWPGNSFASALLIYAVLPAIVLIIVGSEISKLRHR